MSYHAQKSAGQRSFGLIFVVVFHILLVYGLASGLAGDLSSKVAEVLQTKVVEEAKVEDVVEPPPPPPDTKIPPPDFVPPPSFDFVPDAPANSTAIQAVQHTVAKPVVEAPTNITRPTQTKRGNTDPDYPPASARLGEEGLVGINMYVGEDGRVKDVKLVKSSGFERLDDAVLKHVLRAWKFNPCMQGTEPVACWYPLNVRMKLK